MLREALLAQLPDIAVEMLLGVRAPDAQDFLQRGVPVRLYVPFGDGRPRRRGEAAPELESGTQAAVDGPTPDSEQTAFRGR